MRDTALVVPSIRKDSFDRFVAEWTYKTGLLDRVDLVLIEDGPQKTFDISRVQSGPSGMGDAEHRHFSWDDINRYDWSWIIPRRSDTVRSFGYWYAWQHGYDYIMTLDDDCYPAEGYEELDLLHRSMMTRTRWFNTLNSVRPRGVPYFNTGKRDVYINHGIWQGVLDYDAPQQLVNPIPETYTHDNRIVPSGAYFPFCGMNWMCRREAIPLAYHLLMGHRMTALGSLERLPFDRWGDIWCGLVAKRVCDHLGWAASTGTPYVHHDRASDPFANIRKEANGLQVNEWMWQAIDGIEFPSDQVTAIECYRHIGHAVRRLWDRDSPGAREHEAYFDLVGYAMVTWASLFD